MIPGVAASETGGAQTIKVMGLKDCEMARARIAENDWKRCRRGCKPRKRNPSEAQQDPEYGETRGILSEAGGTIRQG